MLPNVNVMHISIEDQTYPLFLLFGRIIDPNILHMEGLEGHSK